MADYLPQANGLWSTTTWITAFGGLSAFAGGNTPPTIIDDVYADGKTITIDINTAVRTLFTTTSPRTGGLAGGGFVLSNGISLSANCQAGTTTCLIFGGASPNTATLVGNALGSSASTNTHGAQNSSTGTLFIFGITRGGNSSNSSFGATNSTSGTLSIVGSAIGGTNSSCHGAQNSSTGTLNITGSVIGTSSSNTNFAINNNSTGTINVLGNVIGSNSGTGPGVSISNSSGGTVNIVGTVFGGNIASSNGLSNTGTGVVNVTGGVISGGGTTSGSPGILNSAAEGRVTIVGNVSGGNSTSSNANAGIQNSGTNAITNIIGDVFAVGPTNGLNYGVANTSSTGVINITGNVFGGPGSNLIGAVNSSTGSMFINGTATAGVAGAAASNTSTGTMYITKVVGNAFGLGSVGIAAAFGAANSQNGRMYVEQVEFGSRGQTPISGPVYILPSNRNTLTGYTTALGTPVTFYNSLSVDGLLPPVSSVQAGVVYNVGNSVGTMAVPSASAVQFGVPVDNTVGTAALTPQDVWGYSRLSATQVDSMGDRLRNTATTQSIGYQIASFNL